MNYHFKVFCFNFFLFISALNLYAQADSAIISFHAVSSKENVFLNWTIKSGNTCNGIQIYRSTDSINYVEIGRILGVCGSTSQAMAYTFQDDDPVKNSINYYRIEAGNSYSQITSVEFIDIGTDGYQIRPNPVETDAKVYIYNLSKQEQWLRLYNLNGIEVLALKTREEFFELNTSLLLPGLYFFTISSSDNSNLIQDKLVVSP